MNNQTLYILNEKCQLHIFQLFYLLAALITLGHRNYSILVSFLSWGNIKYYTEGFVFKACNRKMIFIKQQHTFQDQTSIILQLKQRNI